MKRPAAANPERRAVAFGLRWYALALFSSAMLNAAPAPAQTSRADFEKWCAQTSSVGAGRCLGYLLAAEDALYGNSIDNVRACLPADIGLAEQLRIVMEWLRANPDAAAPTAIGLVARAWAARYPCPP